jgi:hypothetical protein
VINTLGILYSLFYLSPQIFVCDFVLIIFPNTPRSRLPNVFTTGESRLLCVVTTEEVRPPDVFTTGELRLPGEFITGESLKGLSFKKLILDYFNYLVTCDLCWIKWPYSRDANRLPGAFMAGELIMNTCAQQKNRAC